MIFSTLCSIVKGKWGDTVKQKEQITETEINGKRVVILDDGDIISGQELELLEMFIESEKNKPPKTLLNEIKLNLGVLWLQIKTNFSYLTDKKFRENVKEMKRETRDIEKELQRLREAKEKVRQLQAKENDNK